MSNLTKVNVSVMLFILACVLVAYISLRYHSSVAGNAVDGSISAATTTKSIDSQDQSKGVTAVSVNNNASNFPNSSDEAVIITHPQFGFDPSDVKQLINASDRVFVGTVLSQVGTKTVGEYSYPEFAVKIIAPIKKDIVGPVTVVQTDVAYKNGKTYISDGDVTSISAVDVGSVLLHPGFTYAFSVKEASPTDFGISAPPYDRVLLATSTMSVASTWNFVKETSGYNALRSAAAEIGQLYQFKESTQ